MKKKTVRITAALLMLIATSLVSCTKASKGDTGATGATGAAGTNGTNGINGTNGTNGNANVKAGTITLDNSNWTYSSTAWEYSAGITDAAITADVVTNGMVAIFISNSGTSWLALPYTYYNTTTSSYTYNYQYQVGGATLFIDLSNTTPFSSVATNIFKVVAIGGSLRRAHPNTNWKDYNQVMAIMNEATNKSN